MPVTGHRPSRVVLAWRAGELDKLVLSLIDIAGNDTGPSQPANPPCPGRAALTRCGEGRRRAQRIPGTLCAVSRSPPPET